MFCLILFKFQILQLKLSRILIGNLNFLVQFPGAIFWNKNKISGKIRTKSVFFAFYIVSLYLLSKEELLFAVDCCGNVNCRKSDRRDQIVSAIADSIPYKEILDTVRLSLKRRESSSVS